MDIFGYAIYGIKKSVKNSIKILDIVMEMTWGRKILM